MPVLLVVGIQTLSHGSLATAAGLRLASSWGSAHFSPPVTVSGTRLIPKVGREGIGASKKWIGKLLVSPFSLFASSRFAFSSGACSGLTRHSTTLGGKSFANSYSLK